MANTLVVYYSQTGHTERAALDLARRLGGDTERIMPQSPRTASKLSQALGALLGREDPVRPPTKRPADYPLVVIASPVWAARLPPPVRGYLRAERGRIGRVAFLVTCGGAGSAGALRALRNAVGHGAEATVVITDADRHSGDDAAKIARFASALAGWKVSA